MLFRTAKERECLGIFRAILIRFMTDIRDYRIDKKEYLLNIWKIVGIKLWIKDRSFLFTVITQRKVFSSPFYQILNITYATKTQGPIFHCLKNRNIFKKKWFVKAEASSSDDSFHDVKTWFVQKLKSALVFETFINNNHTHLRNYKTRLRVTKFLPEVFYQKKKKKNGMLTPSVASTERENPERYSAKRRTCALLPSDFNAGSS